MWTTNLFHDLLDTLVQIETFKVAILGFQLSCRPILAFRLERRHDGQILRSGLELDPAVLG
jgi:hypothetical protein